MMVEITDEHANRLPTVRIQKAVIDNFKSVEHGEILLNCGRHFFPYGTHSDILGIYGQNGSGKTTFIEVLSILKALMSGSAVSPIYADCIKKDAEYARAEITFELQYPKCEKYPDGEVRTLTYAFSLESVENREDDAEEDSGKVITHEREFSHKIRVFDESVSFSGMLNGEKCRSQQLIDTSVETAPFGPNAKVKNFYTKSPAADVDLFVSKKMASKAGKSFIFSPDTLEIFGRDEVQKEKKTPFFEMLLEMRLYATAYLYVIDTRSSGIIRLNYGIPFYFRRGVIVLDGGTSTKIPAEIFDEISCALESTNLVLNQLIPGMTLSVRKTSEVTMKNGMPGVTLEVLSHRGDITLPLQSESDGVRKIISSLYLLIQAYNEQSFTLAIDEFDAGVFEYLLGEILKTFDASGKGQFIFTSHNLRPLEIINKDCILFTTTNPQNRYLHIKNVGQSNNLRDVYFREILMNEQDEKLYNATKRYMIAAAFSKAGTLERRDHNGEAE